MLIISLPRCLGCLKNLLTSELQSWQETRLVDFRGPHNPFPPALADTLEHEHFLLVGIKNPVLTHTKGQVLFPFLLVIAQLGTRGNHLNHNLRYPDGPNLITFYRWQGFVDGNVGMPLRFVWGNEQFAFAATTNRINTVGIG